MPIQPISLATLLPPRSATSVGATAQSGATSFEGVLGQTLQTLSSTQKSSDQNAIGLATGTNVNLVDSVLSMEQTSLDFKMAMQVRDKVIEAYQDVMRTQI